MKNSNSDIADSFKESIRTQYCRLEYKIAKDRNSNIKRLSLRKDIKEFKFVSRVDFNLNLTMKQNSMNSSTSTENQYKAMANSTEGLNRINKDLLKSIFQKCDGLIDQNKSLKLVTENQKYSMSTYET